MTTSRPARLDRPLNTRKGPISLGASTMLWVAAAASCWLDLIGCRRAYAVLNSKMPSALQTVSHGNSSPLEAPSNHVKLVKPFAFDELVARVRALLRRGRPAEPPKLRLLDLEMDVAARTVTRAGGL